jgi:hypothetical protein
MQMKVRNLLTMCGVAAAVLFTAGSVFAQNNGGGGGGGGQGGGMRRGSGGGGGGGQGGGGGGNFDPAQFQQRMMQRYQDGLAITNETEWSAIQPLVQKVVDARMAVGFGGRGAFGRGGRGGGGQGGQGGGGFPGQQPNPEREALQKAIDDNAPTSQIKDLLTKYEASQKAKQAKLVSAQGDLRKVLTVKQEASATLLGLLD